MAIAADTGIETAGLTHIRAVARVPGRGTFVGEHLDYLGGRFLSFAIDRELTVIARRTADRITVRSAGHRGTYVHRPWTGEETGWQRYVAAILNTLSDVVPLVGSDVTIASRLPSQRGLGSSGALLVAMALAVSAISGHELGADEIVDLALAAESRLVGAHVGTLDQLTPLFARRGQAMYVDSRTRAPSFLLVPVAWRLFLIDPGTPRPLLRTPFEERGLECALALKVLREPAPQLESLCDERVLDSDLRRLPPVLERRARHVRDENRRVAQAAAALEVSDLPALAAVMTESQASLSHHFETSTPVLDAVAASVRRLAQRDHVTAAARLSGGGFGGVLLGVADDPAWVAGLGVRLRRALGRPVAVSPIGLAGPATVVSGSMN